MNQSRIKEKVMVENSMEMSGSMGQIRKGYMSTGGNVYTDS